MLTKPNDTLGDFAKALEAVESDRRSEVGAPLYVRIDGHAFSAFTRRMERPFDARLADAMTATMVGLVDAFHARIGYTQSDEISLVFHDPENELPHGGKYQKLVSRLASKATALFTVAARSTLAEFAEKMPPEFDARAFEVPDLDAAAAVLQWRQIDAIKNSVSMAARTFFSHRQLHEKNRDDMLAMMAEKGVKDFFGEYPWRFTRGAWARRVTEPRELTVEELGRIPEKYRPVGPVLRSSVKVFDLAPLSAIDRTAILFPDWERIETQPAPQP